MKSEQNCFYHPDRPAVAKCERCQKLLCLEDKMIHRIYRGMESADDVYTLCPECYNQAKIESKGVQDLVKSFDKIFVYIIIAMIVIPVLLILFIVLMS